MRKFKFRVWDKRTEKLQYDQSSILYALALEFIDDNDYYTIIQFTGLKDKKGKEIYEGDILNNGEDLIIGTIKWYDEDGSARFELYDHHNKEWYWLGEHYFVDNMQVIGNIYENPELLGEYNTEKAKEATK